MSCEEDIDFTSYISDLTDVSSSLKIIIKSLPNKGVLSLKATNSNVFIGGVYSPNDLHYKSNICDISINQDSFTYSSKNINLIESATELVTITFSKYTLDICKSLNQLFYNQTCVTKCPELFGVLNNTCLNCKSLEPPQYNYNSICYSNKPAATIITNLDYNIATDCINLHKLVYKSECVDTCHSPTIYGEYDNNCVDCSILIPLRINSSGKCIESDCPEGKGKYPLGIICIDWYKESKYLLNGIIVDSCPGHYFSNDKNICLICEKYIYRNNCVNECPVFHVADENGKCIANCPPSTTKYNNIDEVCECKYCYYGILCDKLDLSIRNPLCDLVNYETVSNIQLSILI